MHYSNQMLNVGHVVRGWILPFRVFRACRKFGDEHLMNEAVDAHTLQDLIRAAQGGDHAAFGELVRTYQSYAYALAMRFVWDHAEAEDIVQESCIQVLAALCFLHR